MWRFIALWTTFQSLWRLYAGHTDRECHLIILSRSGSQETLNKEERPGAVLQKRETILLNKNNHFRNFSKLFILEVYICLFAINYDKMFDALKTT